ncbi:aldose epimerase family protein [Sphingomonas abietis]|uniref:Aldose 1-epimerase n=1 Tax=Sphingomonas abietis TaxID=3012344 RepID=A0ABY7NS08_9SPHN|nr:aldose epimerase family protein [Sphingomonas abietis]WBO23236.1 galactose mutarotase [Sphingomonas abietis]
MVRTTTKGAALLATCLTAGFAAGSATATTVARHAFGTMADGRTVEAITLANSHGMSATIITLGASVQSVIVPDAQGNKADVVLGYDDLKGYADKPNFFGATVGRVANRIAKGQFTLDGQSYQLPLSDGPNSLHGGTKGFDKVLWQLVSATPGPVAKVVLRYVSPDGDQGYPGTLTTTATYSLDEKGDLAVDYSATTDKPTIVNISNHTFWNLAGEGSPRNAMAQRLTIPADEYSPTDATAIPTGEFRKVAGTVFDFRKPTPVGDRVRDGSDIQIRYGRGYDHNWVVSRKAAAAPRVMARVEDPVSGRTLEVISAQPGIQFYSGNFLDGTIIGKSNHVYRGGDAIVLEPQMFPDTPNHPAFGSIRLDPGQTYTNHIVFRFSNSPR